eukprot:TRINITY_DN1404_c0_g1_i1.p1 TRINITY_DN1404_c0_g1~~TRINITY_DN1404_c0_g1_i1.p1  ORF type:complete len:247 (+),score=5.66 TRINITY_DN1404_c0_g1_i1:97-741(+)
MMKEMSIYARMPNLDKHIHTMLKNRKETKFVESVEVQMLFRDRSQIRFLGPPFHIMLPHSRRYTNEVCLIGDAEHIEEARNCLDNKIDVVDIEVLKAFNKNKKAIKKWAMKYNYLLCSNTIIRTVPKISGSALPRAGKFPFVVFHDKPLEKAIEEQSRNLPLRMFRRDFSVGGIIGNVKLSEEQIKENLMTVFKSILYNRNLIWKYIMLKCSST